MNHNFPIRDLRPRSTSRAGRRSRHALRPAMNLLEDRVLLAAAPLPVWRVR
jgi:hypothetical protein